MTEQQKIIFEGACRLMSGLIGAGALKVPSDPECENWNKYCIRKAEKLYNMSKEIVK